MKKIDTILAYVCATIFLQTLFFKFTGASESIWIFKTIGIEPWGRYLSGGVELLSSILLLRSSTRILGALTGLGTMSVAFVCHLTFLGIEVQNDGGLLFVLCVTSLLSCVVITKLRWHEIPRKILGFGFLLLVPTLGQSKVLPNIESGVGIHGYDPVSYFLANGPVEGKKNLSFKFEGVTYLFANDLNREAFKKEPQRYVPAYGGWCAYAMADGDTVDIDPKTFKIIDGKTYLFYNGLWGNTLTKWQKNERDLKNRADQAWIKIQ